MSIRCKTACEYQSAQRTVDKSAAMREGHAIPHPAQCIALGLRLMVKLQDEDNSWNSYCVILFSKSDICWM